MKWIIEKTDNKVEIKKHIKRNTGVEYFIDYIIEKDEVNKFEYFAINGITIWENPFQTIKRINSLSEGINFVLNRIKSDVV